MRIQARGKTYSLPEISALVLKELKAIAETSIGERQVGLYRQTRYAMGTHCEIRAWCSSGANALTIFDKGFREIERIEQVFSAFRDVVPCGSIVATKLARPGRFGGLASPPVRSSNRAEATGTSGWTW